ncbi:MAG: hypothetical protein KDD64_09980, partial [Bdellovibrionales bacterium]|nr:hypothetical protein [Bdellovibrionales bacterium]
MASQERLSSVDGELRDVPSEESPDSPSVHSSRSRKILRGASLTVGIGAIALGGFRIAQNRFDSASDAIYG